MKKCSQCKLDKEESEFQKNGNRLRSNCRDCNRKPGVKIQNRVIDGMKVCSICKQNKSVGEYFKRGSRLSGVSSMCKLCEKEYREQYKDDFKQWNHESYLRNKDVVNARSKQRTEETIQYILLKKNKPCMDCKSSFPSKCMEFDHVPERGIKLFNLSRMSWQTHETIDLEIAKCDVVCKNCHASRTTKRGITNQYSNLISELPKGV